MHHILRIIFILLLLSVSGLITWFFFNRSVTVLPHNYPQNPDSYMINVEGTQFDTSGTPKHTFQSKRVVHYEEGKMEIDSPSYVFHSLNQSSWEMKADHAEVLNSNQVVNLSGHVSLKQLPGSNSRSITILTDQLFFYPSQSRAHTDRPVQILKPGTRMQAIGLEANFKKGTIQLLSQIEGESL